MPMLLSWLVPGQWDRLRVIAPQAKMCVSIRVAGVTLREQPMLSLVSLRRHEEADRLAVVGSGYRAPVIDSVW